MKRMWLSFIVGLAGVGLIHGQDMQVTWNATSYVDAAVVADVDPTITGYADSGCPDLNGFVVTGFMIFDDPTGEATTGTLDGSGSSGAPFNNGLEGFDPLEFFEEREDYSTDIVELLSGVFLSVKPGVVFDAAWGSELRSTGGTLTSKGTLTITDGDGVAWARLATDLFTSWNPKVNVEGVVSALEGSCQVGYEEMGSASNIASHVVASAYASASACAAACTEDIDCAAYIFAEAQGADACHHDIESTGDSCAWSTDLHVLGAGMVTSLLEQFDQEAATSKEEEEERREQQANTVRQRVRARELKLGTRNLKSLLQSKLEATNAGGLASLTTGDCSPGDDCDGCGKGKCKALDGQGCNWKDSQKDCNGHYHSHNPHSHNPHDHSPHSHNPHSHDPHRHTNSPTKSPTTQSPTTRSPTASPTSFPTAFPTGKPTYATYTRCSKIYHHDGAGSSQQEFEYLHRGSLVSPYSGPPCTRASLIANSEGNPITTGLLSQACVEESTTSASPPTYTLSHLRLLIP